MKYETLKKDGLKCPLCNTPLSLIGKYVRYNAHKCLKCGKGWHVKID